MSSSNDTAGSDLSPQEASDIANGQRIMVAAAGLLVLFSLVSIKWEIKYIWSRNIRVGGVLYLFAIYGAIAQTVISLIRNLNSTLPDSTCTPLQAFNLSLSIISVVGVQGLTLSITVTVARAHKWMIWIMWLLFFVMIGINFAFFKFISCNLAIEGPIEVEYDILQLLNSISVILFEVTAISIILNHTWGLYRRRSRDALQVSLLSMLIRGGVFRFAVNLLWNIYGVISVKIVRPSLVGIDTPLQNVFAVIIMCHLSLQLCRVQRKLSEAQCTQGQFTTKIEQNEDEEDDFEGRIGLRINDGTWDRAHGPDAVLTWQRGSGSVQQPQQRPRPRKPFDVESQSSQFSDDEDQESPSLSSPPRAYNPPKPRMVHASGTIV